MQLRLQELLLVSNGRSLLGPFAAAVIATVHSQIRVVSRHSLAADALDAGGLLVLLGPHQRQLPSHLQRAA